MTQLSTAIRDSTDTLNTTPPALATALVLIAAGLLFWALSQLEDGED